MRGPAWTRRGTRCFQVAASPPRTSRSPAPSSHRRSSLSGLRKSKLRRSPSETETMGEPRTPPRLDATRRRGAIGVARDEGLVRLDADHHGELVAQTRERWRPVAAGQGGRWVAVGLPDVGYEAGRRGYAAVAPQHHRRDCDLAENLGHHLRVVFEPTGVVDRPSVRGEGVASRHLGRYRRPRGRCLDRAGSLPINALG